MRNSSFSPFLSQEKVKKTNNKINIEANYFVPAAEPLQLAGCPSPDQRACPMRCAMPIPVLVSLRWLSPLTAGPTAGHGCPRPCGPRWQRGTTHHPLRPLVPRCPVRMWRLSRSRWGQWPPRHWPSPGPGGQVLVMAGAAESVVSALYPGTLPTKPIPSHPETGAEGSPPRHHAVPAVFQLFPRSVSGFPLALPPQHPGGFVSTTRFKCLISL